MEAGAGGLLAKAFVGGQIILFTQVMRQAQLKGPTVGVNLGIAIKVTQHLCFNRSVKAFDLTVALWIAGSALDVKDLELAQHLDDIRGNKTRASIQVKGIHHPVGAHRFVETAHKQFRVLGGSYHHMKSHAGGIIEEKIGHATKPSGACSKVFAVAQPHLHPMGIGKTPAVTIHRLFAPAGVDAHAF